jgi:hypothetical protein
MEAQITIRYLRRVQVAQFEPAEAEASVTTSVPDYQPAVVARMLAELKAAVLSAHGASEATPVSPTSAASAPAPAAPAADHADRSNRPAGRGRKGSAVTPPAEEAEVKVVPIETAPVETLASANTAEPELDLEAFQAEVLRLAASHGPTGAEVVRTVRAEFGAAKIRDIPAERRAEFIATVKARLQS